MPPVQIRGLSSEVIAALKRRAARNGRSLEDELKHILATLAREESVLPLSPLRLNLSDALPKTSWSREEIYDEDGR